jgi:hypothetical protein
MKYHHRMSHACHDNAAAVPSTPKGDTVTTQSTTRPTTAPRIQVCPACGHAISTIPELLYHVRTHHLDIASLRVTGQSGSPKCIPWLVPSYTCAPCVLRRMCVKREGLMRLLAASHDQRTLPRPTTRVLSLLCAMRHPIICLCALGSLSYAATLGAAQSTKS